MNSTDDGDYYCCLASNCSSNIEGICERIRLFVIGKSCILQNTSYLNSLTFYDICLEYLCHPWFKPFFTNASLCRFSYVFVSLICRVHIFTTVDMFVSVHKDPKRELGQYPAILTELAWSIKHLLHGIKNTEKMIFKLVYFRHSASVNSSCALRLFKCGIVFFKCFVRRLCSKKLFSEEFRL